MKRIRLCDACANLFKVAYTVKKLPATYSKGGAASCENCGKRVVLLDTYELTLKGRE